MMMKSIFILKTLKVGTSGNPYINSMINDLTLLSKSNEKLLELIQKENKKYKEFTDNIEKNLAELGVEPASQHSSLFMTQNETAWFNSSIFIAWIQTVIIPCRRDPNDRILLIVDCFSGHRTLEVAVFCQENNMDLLLVPPCTTALLQPLDISINRTIKTHMRKITIMRIFNDHTSTGSKIRGANSMSPQRFYGALLLSINNIQTKSVHNGFHSMVYKARNDQHLSNIHPITLSSIKYIAKK